MKSLNLSEWAVRHPTIILFLIILLGGSGALAYLQLGRAEDPSFTVKAMTVTVTWPGASAEDMELQVTDRIEKKLQEVPYFDYVRSFSAPNGVTLFLNLKDYTPPSRVADSWYQARKKIGDIRASLPSGVLGPFFNDEFGDVYGSIYAFQAEDGWSQADLKKYIEDARNRVLRLPDVSKADLIGIQDQKVFIEFSYHKLASLGIASDQLFASLQRQNAVTGSGSVETPSDLVYLRVQGRFATVEAVAATPVQAGGRILRLGDIARVYRGYQDPPTFMVRFDGKPVYELAVSMAPGGDILKLGQNLGAEIAAIRRELPAGITVAQVADQPKIVHDAIGEFTESLAEALAIVLVVSFITLGWRTGIVVALSVPLVLAITFVIMQALGIDLQRISLGALILSLGLLVDDAIIAVEMMVVKMESGWDRLNAATFAYSSTAFPMLTGTLVTAIGFVPVGFAKSVAGEYAGGIFWVTGIALVVSWIVAVVFTPYLGYYLIPREKLAAKGGVHHDPYSSRVYQRLRTAVAWSLDHKKLVVGATVAAFVVSLWGLTKVPRQFFPQSARPELIVDMTLREGASITATEAQARAFEAWLAKDPDVVSYATYVGAGSPRFYLSLDQQLPSPNFAQVVIVTSGLESREALRARLFSLFQIDFPLVRTRVARLEFGPPVGYPVQFRVEGPDAARVREIAYRVRDVMSQNRHARDVNLDWNELSKMVRLEVDQDRLRLLGLTPSDISTALNTLLAGAVITQYREGIEAIDVIARAISAERLDLDHLGDISISTGNGASVALSQVARLVYGLEEPRIWRRSRDTTITVRADPVDGIQPPVVMAELESALRPIVASLPEGFRIEVGGTVESSAKSQAGIQRNFPVMIALMLLVLVLQLQSFSRLALVVLTAPLGLIGVAASMLLLNAPYGFVANLGVIALSGIIMRNSVILVDQIEHDIAEGRSPRMAVIDATIRRARPIVLTALAAVLALIPLSRSVFWGPMAVAMMGGLLVATFLTLFFLPALYALWFRVKRLVAEEKFDASHVSNQDEPLLVPSRGQAAE
jgi:multidrug efflux pump